MSDEPVLVVLAAGMAKRFGGCKPLAPVGLAGEAVIDLTVGDARAAGFGDVVLVLGPATGPAIEYHVKRTWPRSVPVSFALQAVPLGTAHAVLCARKYTGDRAFAAINADDVYGVAAFEILANHLKSGRTEHALVTYSLADTVVVGDPVTRGTCQVDAGGLLTGMAERKQVQRHADGSITSGDGREPAELAGDTPVSVNLWGFQPSIWPELERAVITAHPEVSDTGDIPLGGTSSSSEVLLPEVMSTLVQRDSSGGAPHRVLTMPGPGRCIGVTHAADLPVVQRELAAMVGRGERPANPWNQS